MPRFWAFNIRKTIEMQSIVCKTPVLCHLHPQTRDIPKNDLRLHRAKLYVASPPAAQSHKCTKLYENAVVCIVEAFGFAFFRLSAARLVAWIASELLDSRH